MSRSIQSACVALALLVCASAAFAQDAGRQGRAGRAQNGVAPGELQRLFEAYEMMQAQDALHLTDVQSPQFFARMKTLQSARRRGTADRAKIIAELRRLSAPDATPDEAQLKNALKALDDVDRRTADEVRQAMDGVNQILDVRQQARFRVFEEQMERRKVDLLMRARRP